MNTNKYSGRINKVKLDIPAILFQNMDIYAAILMMWASLIINASAFFYNINYKIRTDLTSLELVFFINV